MGSAPQPEFHRVPNFAANTSGRSGGGGSTSIINYLTASCTYNAGSQKRVMIQIGALLLLLYIVPRDLTLKASAYGVEITSVAFARDLTVLIGAMLLARLTAIMAEGARLAHAFGASFEVGMPDDEKQIALITVGDSSPEQRLFDDRQLLEKFLYYFFYYPARVFEGLSYYVLLLALVGALEAVTIQGLRLSWRNPSLPSPAWQLVWVLTALFTGQSIAALFQYWVSRRLMPGQGRPDLLALPKRYSLSSILAWLITIPISILKKSRGVRHERLMPRSDVESEVRSIVSDWGNPPEAVLISLISKRFNVSEKTARVRLRDLGLLPAGQYSTRIGTN